VQLTIIYDHRLDFQFSTSQCAYQLAKEYDVNTRNDWVTEETSNQVSRFCIYFKYKFLPSNYFLQMDPMSRVELVVVFLILIR